MTKAEKLKLMGRLASVYLAGDSALFRDLVSYFPLVVKPPNLDREAYVETIPVGKFVEMKDIFAKHDRQDSDEATDR